MVANLQLPGASQQGKPKRIFDLVDDNGWWFKCCALGDNASSRALEAGAEIVICFGTGRAGLGGNPGMVYLMKGSVIAGISAKQQQIEKKNRIDIS